MQKVNQMRLRDFRKKEQPLIMIIPMIDIMLFLLVFFMISTIYMVQTNNFEVNLPQSETAAKDIKSNVVKVTVAENGDIFFEDEKILKNQLPQKIFQTLTANNETVFVLFGDKSAKYEQVIYVLDLLKKFGVKNISIATEAK